MKLSFFFLFFATLCPTNDQDPVIVLITSALSAAVPLIMHTALETQTRLKADENRPNARSAVVVIHRARVGFCFVVLCCVLLRCVAFKAKGAADQSSTHFKCVATAVLTPPAGQRDQAQVMNR